jgi:hypothetical protein
MWKRGSFSPGSFETYQMEGPCSYITARNLILRNNAGGVYKNIDKKEKIPLIFLFILYANTLKCTIFLIAAHKKGGF